MHKHVGEQLPWKKTRVDREQGKITLKPDIQRDAANLESAEKILSKRKISTFESSRYFITGGKNAKPPNMEGLLYL